MASKFNKVSRRLKQVFSTLKRTRMVLFWSRDEYVVKFTNLDKNLEMIKFHQILWSESDQKGISENNSTPDFPKGNNFQRLMSCLGYQVQLTIMS